MRASPQPGPAIRIAGRRKAREARERDVRQTQMVAASGGVGGGGDE